MHQQEEASMSGSARVITGVALGIAVTLLTVVGVSAIRGSTTGSLLGTGAVPGGAQILSGADALALGCQPYESALVHRVSLYEQPMVTVRCVMLSAARPVPSDFRTWDAAAEAPAFRPVATQSVGATSEPSVAMQPTPRPAQRVVSRPSGRSWQKTMMVIGGSTAAGAGVGGLIGGKKGALVGGAIGGGASTIYESAKR